MKPEAWRPDTVDASATASSDGRRIVVKAVNYERVRNAVFVRLQGSRAPADAAVRVFGVSGDPNDAATLREPNRIAPMVTTMAYAKDLAIDLPPYSIAVVEIAAR
jgi:alpha-N-arabinofuranosidase